MKGSRLLKQIFSLVLATILIAILLITLLYTFISRQAFVQIKTEELMPKARMLARLISKQQAGSLSMGTLMEFIDATEAGESLLGSFALVTDADQSVLLHSAIFEEEDIQSLAGYIEKVSAGNEINANHYFPRLRVSMVCVGTPVEGAAGSKGVVLLLIPLYEAMAAMGSLNTALMLSVVLMLPLTLALAFVVTSRMVRPLRQMRDVAISMANGNFSVRANDVQRGEIGQLGRSLNFLARELSRTVSALELERNRLKQIVDGLSEGIVAVDTLGNVTHHNPAIEQLFGKRESQPLAEPEEDVRLALIPNREVWEDFDRTVEENCALSRSLNLPDRVLRIDISPLTDEGGNTVGAVGLFSDITKSERLERTRRDYVANVSHEMRTPLTAMRALVEPMRDGIVKTEEARQRYYNIILRETMRLSRLIDDLMELSRLQSGALALNCQPISLRPLIEELAEKYRGNTEEAGLKFHMAVNLFNLPMVISNADRVEQVLVILLDNAIKYTPEGGSVTLGARWDDREVTLCVRDSGIGIAPADQPYVFDRFYKVDKAHSGLGSGLGLSIAKEILQWMGETIGVRSEPGKGSEFFFTLKRCEGEMILAEPNE